MSYDQKCRNLAAMFLEEHPEHTPDDRDQLAQAIQTTIEDYLMKFDEPKPMKMGKVFYVGDAGDWFGLLPRPTGPGWYYQIDMAKPIGPFDTQLDAGKAARAVIHG